MVSVEPKTTDVDVAVVTRAGATMGEDGPRPQIWLDGQKKEPFDITTEKKTFVGAWDAIGRNLGKSPVYEMPYAFDSSLEVGPLQQPGTLQLFFEGFLSLAWDLNALTKIENLLHHPSKEWKDSMVNYLHKKKMGKEMHMNIQIGDYEVDSCWCICNFEMYSPVYFILYFIIPRWICLFLQSGESLI